jgi:hypothetical protein
MYSKKTVGIIGKQVSDYLFKIQPDTLYWKGKHTWGKMVDFRKDLGLKKSKSGFSENDQSCILKWGGINRFTHFELMEGGLKELSDNNLSFNTYSRISSLSKLFSFYNPNKFFILDARVALTVNHLICKENSGDLYIPFNPKKSKGKKVKSALESFQGEAMFDDLGQAYLAYNSLVLSIFQNISIPNGLPKKPEIIEMAIFSMAERISESYLKSK